MHLAIGLRLIKHEERKGFTKDAKYNEQDICSKGFSMFSKTPNAKRINGSPDKALSKHHSSSLDEGNK
jgi:hypothetical protein